jgi:energy-converting hydrogenase A subunit R
LGISPGKEIRRPVQKIAFFDLEGPLSPQDNAFEVMSLLDGGREAFAVISRYDDLRALQGVEGYEPGDTLKLILPFLILHGIGADDIRAVSRMAPLTAGAKELAAALLAAGWQMHIISTSYEQHALRIAGELGIAEKNVACTRLDLRNLAERVGGADLTFVRDAWEDVRRSSERLTAEEIADGAADAQIGPRLDAFYWETIPRTPLGPVFDAVEVLGGRRKVRALESFCQRSGTYLGEVAVVGDSITDAQMLKVAEAAGGLAVVFNGNRYALPYGTVGVASASLMNVLPVLETWLDGGREALRRAILSSRLSAREGEAAYHWLVSASDLDEVAQAHAASRKAARGRAAASLG